MSSILEGLYNEEEQSAESELRRKLDKVESILGTRTDMRGRQFNQAIQDITKNIKYLQQDELVMEIYSKMQSMAEAIGLSEKELDYVEDDVREAFNNLESAVYKMEEPFEDYVRDLQYKVEELELDEGMYDQEAFNTFFFTSIFKISHNVLCILCCSKKITLSHFDFMVYSAFPVRYKSRFTISFL